MAIVAGTRLGPYEIQSALGAGGMGEVYRARDLAVDAPPQFAQPQYAVAPDGQRFLLNVAKQTTEVPVTVVLNWPAAIRK